ncbi:hypothetical protein JHK84_038426 [Glycine max]|nr:hypothetical protein JHK85_038767 [Glycine max]KAG4978731.1 hypothetical protein JHK86_038205 [Glycine max]KAG5132029.1 hypothetical protein JHK84_038426 [Glycine max]
MSLVCFHSFFRRVASTVPSPLLNAVTWTLLLIVTVVLVSLATGVAFVLAISPSSSFSKPCNGVRIPLDFPREMVCLPEHAVMSSSRLDFFLPTLFAALVVAASTCLLRSVASSTLLEDGGVPKAASSATLLKEAIHVISCGYEDKTEWGKEVGWIYGSVTEDILTGFKMHCHGWRSVYCMPKRPAFKGSTPINLSDRLHQVLRWALGSVEIFFSRHCPIWYGYISYINSVIYPLTSIPLIAYCALPTVCLLTGKFIVPEELFLEVGDVKRHTVHYDRSGRSKGTAEVVFSRRADAVAAVKRYNNVQLDGKPMKVEIVGTNIATHAAPPAVNGTFGNPTGVPRSGQGRSGSLGRPRGGSRGRGSIQRGRGRGRGGRDEKVSAEDLDADLEKYHAEAMQLN